MDEVRKYNGEKFPVSVDFCEHIATGETISAANSAVTVYDGDTVVNDIIIAGSLAVSGSKLFIGLENGEAKKVYKVKFEAYISASKILQFYLQLRILEFQVKI